MEKNKSFLESMKWHLKMAGTSITQLFRISRMDDAMYYRLLEKPENLRAHHCAAWREGVEAMIAQLNELHAEIADAEKRLQVQAA